MTSNASNLPVLDRTHDASLRSWVESANDPASDFPIQNLPFCGFKHPDGTAHSAIRIGDVLIDLRELMHNPAFLKPFVDDITSNERALAEFIHFSKTVDPNEFMALDATMRRSLRSQLSDLLRDDNPVLRDDEEWRDRALFDATRASYVLPCDVGNYTDFYASIHHATTVGRMFRPDNPLLPNYKHVPIGYHGRASSVVVSGTSIRRPWGQQSPPESLAPGADSGPSFGPSKMLDYELEVGLFVGTGSGLGQTIPISKVRDHMFGICLVNDWSARDVQKWEYQPLGPFLAKNFATTVSPYVVTLGALEPFRVPALDRSTVEGGGPVPLPYLSDPADQSAGAIDITLEVLIQSVAMKEKGIAPMLLSRSNAFRELWWTLGQLLTHHASNGCNMNPGDLLASGTVSGREPDTRGCLLELTWDGVGADGKPKARRPITLPSGETRTFLADGDTVIMRGFCERPGFRRIGLGECVGTILPAWT